LAVSADGHHPDTAPEAIAFTRGPDRANALLALFDRVCCAVSSVLAGDAPYRLGQ